MSTFRKPSIRLRLEVLEQRQLLSGGPDTPCDLTDWVGQDNQTSPNDYAVLSPTSAGGTFKATFPRGIAQRHDLGPGSFRF